MLSASVVPSPFVSPYGRFMTMVPRVGVPEYEQAMPSAGSSREQEEFERLRNALSASQAEVARLRANLRSQELQNERNSEELNTYREALQKRDDEYSSSRTTEDRNRSAAVLSRPVPAATMRPLSHLF